MIKSKFILIAKWILLLMSVMAAHASPVLTQLSPEFDNLYERIGENPQSVAALLESRQIDNYPNTTDQVQHLYILSQVASALDISSDMLSYSRQGMALINEAEQPWLFHMLKLTEISGLNRQGLAAGSFAAATSALNWAQTQSHLQLELVALTVLGELYISMALYKQAIEHLHAAYQKAPTTGKGTLKAHVAWHLAGIYITRSEFEIAIPYLEESLAHNRAEQIPIAVSIDLFELGRANLVTGNTDLGQTQLLESKAIATELKDLQGIAHATNELGYYELSQNNITAAEQLANEAHLLFSNANNKIMQYDNFLLLTDIQLAKQAYEQAQTNLDAASELIDPELKPSEALRIQFYQAKLMAAQGQHLAAYNSLLAMIHEQADVDAKQSAAQLHQLRSRYEIETQEAQNQLLAKTNQIQEIQIKNHHQQLTYLAVIVVVSLLFLLFFMFFTFKYKRQSKQLHELANFDELTGLRNRSNTLHTIKKVFANRQPQTPITLVMIDLDHFKKINDLYGHALGDKVLRTFGEYGRSLLVSENDIMGRIGGEEFLLCLPGRDAEQAMAISEQLRRLCVDIPNHMTPSGLKVSLSAGIACSQQEPPFKVLLRQADQAMYQAKANGRNQIVIYNKHEQA